MKIVKSSVLLIIIFAGIFFISCKQGRPAKTLTEIPKIKPDKLNLLTDREIDRKLDSLSRAYKGKSVTLKKQVGYQGRDFRFFRDTLTFKEIPYVKLNEGDMVTVVGETPVSNIRVKIQNNENTGYVDYFDIAEFQFLYSIDPDFN
jgi:hypothetical protein